MVLQAVAVLAALVGFVAATGSSVASVLIAGVCAGIVLGIIRFGPPENEVEGDFDLFGEPYDPRLVTPAIRPVEGAR